MKVVQPVKFDTGQLISTTATDSTAAYDAGVTYTTGQTVYVGTRRYESLQDANIGNAPQTSPDWWLDIGPLNQYAMFDNQVQTQTVDDEEITVVVAPGAIISSVSFLNVTGATLIEVEIVDGADPNEPVIYSASIPMDDSIILDWYDYFFAPFVPRTDVFLDGIPPYSSGIITVTITGGGTVGIGAMIYGTTYELGEVRMGVTSGIRDYSIKDTDEFGNSIFVERPYSKRMEISALVDKSRFNLVHRVLTAVRATPTIFVASEDPEYEPLIIYGFYRDWNTEISYPKHFLLSIEIEGLT